MQNGPLPLSTLKSEVTSNETFEDYFADKPVLLFYTPQPTIVAHPLTQVQKAVVEEKSFNTSKKRTVTAISLTAEQLEVQLAEQQAKKIARMKKNKDAARASRVRHRIYVEGLEKQLKDLTEKSVIDSQQIFSLQNKVEALSEELSVTKQQNAQLQAEMMGYCGEDLFNIESSLGTPSPDLLVNYSQQCIIEEASRKPPSSSDATKCYYSIRNSK